MTVYTVFAKASNDHRVRCADMTWDAARNGSGSFNLGTGATDIIGNGFFSGTTYISYQQFMEFDLSAIPSGEHADAFLSISTTSTALESGEYIEAAEYAHSGSAETGNFRTTAQLGALTLFGSLEGTGSTGVVEISSDQSTLSRSSSYRIIVYGRRQRTNTAPTAETGSGSDYVAVYTASSGGTSNDPYIEIDYDPTTTATVTALSNLITAQTVGVSLAKVVTVTALQNLITPQAVAVVHQAAASGGTGGLNMGMSLGF